MKNLLIMPIGEVNRTVVDTIAHALREIFYCEIAVGESLSMPEKTYNAGRKQYNSTKILQALEALKPGRYECLLGVIDEDLYVPGYNFVFGEADMIARVAVIALPRLRQEFYGYEPYSELFLQRAAKEAIHEIGHVSGLAHCTDPRCVMHFSNSLLDTDVKESKFCARCERSRPRFALK